MAKKDSSWADQWDSKLESNPENTKKNNIFGRGMDKYGQKVGEGYEKTKEVASTGIKKVKNGTSAGFSWIKAKYQKTTQKN